MAINDFVRRSIQIVGGGIAQSTTDYFDNAISFTNDVKEVIDMGKQMGSDGAKKFNELKSSGILKKTRDWFYNEGGMFGDFDFDDDDFDAGFEIDSADSEKDKESTKPLSKDMMSDIAKKQTGAMYKAFGRQADLHIANTAEIISTINTRTAELTASVNNVNNTLIQIGKRLDLIVEWTSARTKKEEEEKRVAGILDYGGGISLSGVVNKAKENAEDSMLGTFMSIGKTMLGSGMMTPETVMSMILSQTILEKKWDKLGGKSINDIGEFINDTVGEVIQNTMTKVLTSKNEILESLFEDIITRSGRKNYQNSVKNTYNDKPAVFDGMTRKSIITVIPGYLNEILKAVSKDGVGREVDSKGNLTKKTTNSFVKEVADSYFRSGTMEWSRRKAAAERTNLDETEVGHAVRTLTGCWVWYLYRSGRVVLEIGEVKDISAPSTRSVVDNAAYMMSTADPKHRSEDEWKSLYQGIIEQIDEFKYRQELQRSAERADKNLETFARSHVNNHQAKTVDESVILQAFRHNYSDFNKDAKFRNPSEPTSTGASPTAIGSGSNLIGITELDYMAGIFDRLNKGLNVFVTGQSNNKKKKYNKINMVPGYAARKIRGGGTSAADDSEEGGIAPVVDKLKDALSNSDKKKEKMDDATKEAYEAKERGEELSKEQKKLLKEYEKQQKTGFIGLLKNKGSKYVEQSQREGIVADPELYADISKAADGVKNFFKEVMPESLKGLTKKIKDTQLYQDISESDTGKKMKEKAAKAKEKAADTLLGEKRTDEEGNEFRAEGLVQKAYVGTGKAIGGIGSFVNRHTPTKILENRTKKLIEEYGPDKKFDEDDSDAQHMQVITGMIYAAMSNGDFSTFDEQAFNKEFDAIKSQDLKRRLKQSVIPLMQKNGAVSDKDEKGGKAEPTSTLGKLGKLIFGGIKLAIGPIITYVKLVIGSVFFIIKKGMGTILKFAMKGIRSGLVDIKSGFKSVVSGVKKMFKPVGKLVKGAINVAYKVGKKMSEIGSSVIKGVKKGFTTVFSGIGKLFGKDKNKPQKDPSQQSGFKKFLSGIGDKFAKSSFGQGFMKARNERKEAQAKSKLKEQAAPVVEGIDTSEAGKDLKEVLESEDGKKGVFKKLITLVQGIFDKVPDQKQEEGNNPETNENTGTENNQQTENEQTEQQSTTPAPAPSEDEGSSGGGGGLKGFMGKVKGGVKGVLGGIGEALGGLTNIMGGILKVVLSIVMSLEGFKALTKLVTTILTESLQPLNKAFQAITKALKPVFKQLGGLIKQLAEFIVVIVDAVVDVIKPILTDVIQPILEVLSPLLEAILGTITPILKIVGILLKVIMAPLMGLFKFVLLPILKIIGDAVQIIMGVLQIGFGVLIMGIGGIIAAIGGLISLVGKIPLLGAVGNVGEGILNTGKDMMSQGKDFVVQGGKSVAQGAVNLVLDYASLYTLGGTDELLGRNDKEEKKETKKIEAPEGNSVDETFANGDVTNIYNTYGGEYQRGMGGYLNMNQRGCGPIALADMYNRNANGRVSARSLAGSMYSNGRYDPHRGTSVGDYIDSARSLGMNLTPGRVTQQSLKSASPTHPITVVGSGSDYGTRRGNNHFMNVIGTDSHGTAFVSNPLTGRIDRKPASTIAGSAVMGLYGSGDEGSDQYTFPDAIKEAFKKLKDEAAKILGLFNMEKSDEEETEELINAEKKKAAVEQAKKQLGDKYDEYEAEAKELARKDYEEKYPKKDGESEEEYEKKFEKFWESNQAEYLAKTKLLDEASKNNKDAWQTMAATSQAFVDNYAGKVNEDGTISGGLFDDLGNAYTKLNEDTKSLGGSSGSNAGAGAGYFTSDSGAVLFTNYEPKVHETNITGSNKSESPLHEFFSILTGGVENSSNSQNSSWYGQYNSPDSQGVGHSGDTHGGIDFNTDMQTAGDDEGKPLYATTDGVVSYVSSGYQNGLGNSIQWKDKGGFYHWYLHMQNPPTKGVGDDVVGGEELGKLGNTGHSYGAHLHYSIHKQQPSSSDDYTVNPLHYFRNYNPNPISVQGKIDLGDNLKKYSAWSSYAGRAGVPTFINAGKAAGMSPAEIATLASTGIWEDGGEKIFGLKSLTGTTYDYNGQAAKGIMNWVDQNVNYGDTVLDQLKYIHNTYFDEASDDWRAKVRDTGFGSQDLQAFKDATGRDGFKLQTGDRYGPYANEDLVEGSAFFFMDALVPEKIHKMQGMAENVGTAAEAYNWMIDNGYATVVDRQISPTGSGSLSTGYGLANGVGDAQILSNVNQIGTRNGKNTGVVITNDSGLNMRDKPSSDGKVFIEIPKGTSLNLETSGSKDWFKTSYAGKTGYVSAHYIALDKNDTTEAYQNAAGYNSVNDEYAKYLNAYQKTARLGSPNVKTSEVVEDFQNYLMNNEGMTWSDIVNAGNKLYTGTWKAGDPTKLWLWARENYGKQGSNNKLVNVKYDSPIGPQLLSDIIGNNDTPITTNGGSGIYNTNNAVTKTTTTVANSSGSSHGGSGHTRGSGDADAILAEDNFWNNYLGWNNKYNSNVSIPMSDGSDTAYSSDTYYDAENGTTVVNNYAVTRAEDKATDARLKAILANTYNVRSESMEALLEAILEELKKRKDPNGGGNNTNGSQKLFDERIPSQVTKLSIG